MRPLQRQGRRARDPPHRRPTCRRGDGPVLRCPPPARDRRARARCPGESSPDAESARGM